MAVIVPSASLWAAFSNALGALLERDWTRQVVSIVLVLATIVLVWI
jgi:hypothetical protein